MKHKKLPDNHLADEIYQIPRFFKLKGILLALALIFLGFVLNAPIRDTITNAVTTQLNSIPGCPLTFEQVETSLFWPKITIKKLSLPPACLKMAEGNSLDLGDINLSFRGPSFFPLGLKLHMYLQRKETEIHAYTALSFFSNIIKIENTTIDSSIFNEILATPSAFEGTLNLEALLTIKKGQITNGKVLLQSTNINIPSQTIKGIVLPQLNIGNIVVKGGIIQSNLKIDSIIIGSESSPIKANCNGSIKLNEHNFVQSRLDLKGEVKFSPDLINKFPIINLLVAGKSEKNGFYPFRIIGPATMPNFNFL